ncbi:MAG TPA: ABC transporter permease [Spirochaetota bacterium]|nr:ABC transporter permease [Spirochaetota bacterium]
MNMSNLLLTALRSLGKNKMRSALTSLGIIIGVASVIMMVGIGNSARVAVRDKVYTYGANAMSISSERPFTERDLERLRRTTSYIKYITPMSGRKAINVKYENRFLESRVRGVNNDFFRIQEWPVTYGRYFTELEILSYEKVAILGDSARLALFGNTNPVGRIILVNNVPFHVIGSLSELGQAFSGRDQDNVVILPFTTTGLKIEGRRDFNEIFASTYSEDLVEKTAGEIRRSLRIERSVLPGQPEDFTVKTSREKLEMAEYIAKTLAILLAGIASISLIVGGIGIMNIMLVSVSERTREIGIRMAIGARKQDILLQFLIEAVTLSTGGGIAGITLGIIIYFIITIAVGWSFLFSLFSIAISFLFSGAVGIFFGYYPARKASSLKPIDALRYE